MCDMGWAFLVDDEKRKPTKKQTQKKNQKKKNPTFLNVTVKLHNMSCMHNYNIITMICVF